MAVRELNEHILKTMLRTLGVLVLLILFSACSYNSEYSSNEDQVADSNDNSNPDGGTDIVFSSDYGRNFSHAEIVRTQNGFQLTGAFGETSERVILSNGYTLEGAFYE